MKKSHYCLICSSFTLINQNIAMAQILFTHTALLIQLSLPLPICLVRVRLALKAPGKRIQERRFFWNWSWTLIGLSAQTVNDSVSWRHDCRETWAVYIPAVAELFWVPSGSMANLWHWSQNYCSDSHSIWHSLGFVLSINQRIFLAYNNSWDKEQFEYSTEVAVHKDNSK